MFLTSADLTTYLQVCLKSLIWKGKMENNPIEGAENEQREWGRDKKTIKDIKIPIKVKKLDRWLVYFSFKKYCGK